MTGVSIIIPVLNEAESLRGLFLEVVEVCKVENLRAELIFVDDGSDDGSWDVIATLADDDSRVRGIRFRRNFGKAAALRAGADEAQHEFIVTIDADLQDDPAEIPNLLRPVIDDEADVVSGWKHQRRDPLTRRWMSRLFNFSVNLLTGMTLHDHNCGFKAYRRSIFDEVQLTGELHRLLPFLARERGFRVSEVPVNHRPRKFGKSKYGWRRLPVGLFDVVTVCLLGRYGSRPQRLLGFFGGGCAGAGAVGLAWMAVYWLLRMTQFPGWTPLHQRPVVLYLLGALIVGVQLLCMGFLAQLIAARNDETRQPYSVRERLP